MFSEGRRGALKIAVAKGPEIGTFSSRPTSLGGNDKRKKPIAQVGERSQTHLSHKNSEE